MLTLNNFNKINKTQNIIYDENNIFKLIEKERSVSLNSEFLFPHDIYIKLIECVANKFNLDYCHYSPYFFIESWSEDWCDNYKRLYDYNILEVIKSLDMIFNIGFVFNNTANEWIKIAELNSFFEESINYDNLINKKLGFIMFKDENESELIYNKVLKSFIVKLVLNKKTSILNIYINKIIPSEFNIIIVEKFKKNRDTQRDKIYNIDILDITPLYSEKMYDYNIKDIFLDINNI